MGIYEKWFYADGWPQYVGRTGREWADGLKAEIDALEDEVERLRSREYVGKHWQKLREDNARLRAELAEAKRQSWDPLASEDEVGPLTLKGEDPFADAERFQAASEDET